MAAVTTLQNLWGIVLAGGNGTRLSQFARKIYSSDRPKQYCAFVGTRSMLRHTIDRAERIIPRTRILTVIDQSHRSYAEDDLRDRPPGSVIVQPRNLDTAPGILYPLLHIYRKNHDALVAILPADHFILGEGRFAETLSTAFTLSETAKRTPILLGARPDRTEPAYGWIEIGSATRTLHGMRLHHVEGFWEKPHPQLAETLYESGCLWNTMIIVGYAITLIRMIQQETPHLYAKFREVRINLGSHRESYALNQAYSQISPENFSQSILERCARRFQVLPMEGVFWADWGVEERIRADCNHFGLRLRSQATARATGIERTDFTQRHTATEDSAFVPLMRH